MNLINNNKLRGNFPSFYWILGLIQSYFSAELAHKTPFVDLGESEGLRLKIELPWMKLLIILQMDDISPDKFTATVFKNIDYSFHMYRLCDDA